MRKACDCRMLVERSAALFAGLRMAVPWDEPKSRTRGSLFARLWIFRTPSVVRPVWRAKRKQARVYSVNGRTTPAF